MQVILKQDVEKLGKRWDQVKVADGYARNYLIPKGLAMEATPQNLMILKRFQEAEARKKQKELEQAEQIAKKIRSLSCVITRQAGEGDKLFGSVTSIDIANFLEENKIQIDRKKIDLEEPIKSLGVFRVPIKLHPEVIAELKVKVVKEENPK
ncbi:MAG TPA: 50S ribosomal protein L9 [Candidatus Limnocylindrales bacterium]|nr:50S ribosomal protein L9 [Candidatus Limnocylindrales bacterium]